VTTCVLQECKMRAAQGLGLWPVGWQIALVLHVQAWTMRLEKSCTVVERRKECGYWLWTKQANKNRTRYNDSWSQFLVGISSVR